MEVPMHGHLVGMRCACRGVVLGLPTPQPSRNGMFFLAHCIRIDGGGGQLRMSQPFLDQIEGNTRGDRRHTKPRGYPVPGTLWAAG